VSKAVFRGQVKFWKRNGWGAIESDHVPDIVYVCLASIDVRGASEALRNFLIL